MMARPHIQSPPTLSSTPCRPQFTAGISLPHHQAPLSMTLSTLAPNRLRYTAPPPTVYPHHPESSPSLVSQPGELSECCQEQYSAHLAARPDVHFRAPVCGMLSMCERPMLEMEVSSHTGCGIQPGSTSPTACPLPGPPPHRLRYTAGLNLPHCMPPPWPPPTQAAVYSRAQPQERESLVSVVVGRAKLQVGERGGGGSRPWFQWWRDEQSCRWVGTRP